MQFVYWQWMLCNRQTQGIAGAPMGMADIADVVWREFLNPDNPTESTMGEPRPFRFIKRPWLNVAIRFASFNRL